MALPSVKTTYSLDVETVRTIARLAEAWKVSRSEALRRAIRAAGGAVPGAAMTPARAFQALRASLRLPGSEAARWARRIRGERRGAGRRVHGAAP